MGGIGKTTLARAVFDRISSQFKSCYFLADVTQQLKTSTTLLLRNELFSKLLAEGEMKTGSVNFCLTYVKDRLQRKKVLVAVDDVDNST